MDWEHQRIESILKIPTSLAHTVIKNLYTKNINSFVHPPPPFQKKEKEKKTGIKMSAEYRGWWEPIKVTLLFPRGYLKLCVILTESVPRTDLNSLFYRILRTLMRESACREQVYCLTKQQPKWLQFESKHQKLFKFLFAFLFNTSKRLCCIIETKKPVWRAKSCNSVPKKYSILFTTPSALTLLTFPSQRNFDLLLHLVPYNVVNL